MHASISRIMRLARVLILKPSEWGYRRAAQRSGLFDATYYRGAYPGLNRLYRVFPLHHFIAYGEAQGYRPNPDFSPLDYLRHNADVASANVRPFLHYIRIGHAEGRLTNYVGEQSALPEFDMRPLRRPENHVPADHAIVAHVYYPDLWQEFEARLTSLKLPFDLYVTLTYRGEETEALAEHIRSVFPAAVVTPVPNRGRDILPFLELVNAGLLDGYRAVCKIHTKKSPHRLDGEVWRRHLISGILPDEGLEAKLDSFVNDPEAAFWVADGQHYAGTEWWGSNLETTRRLLSRVEIPVDPRALSFPAGSMYWMKPLMIGMVRSLALKAADFDREMGQVDGTVAHAFERALGFIATAAGQRVRQTSQIVEGKTWPVRARPTLTSAFYLPQFHPITENDEWWGRGFTEWRGVVNAKQQLHGHLQPMLPADLGYYDLRVTEVMGEQAALARSAGIDAFCVYHYWFDGRRVLEAPIDRLMERADIDFPFYLCWANESWRRNWDGLSGVVLLEQSYASGFEVKLAADTAPYLRDPRYCRPDGVRPRFVIYRPEDMPDPEASVARLRQAWLDLGLDVELGAVRFHVAGEHPVPAELFDFWVEMPPHGLVTGKDYLFGGPGGHVLPLEVAPGFRGVIYDYLTVSQRAADGEATDALPANTIAGIMPSWDNTARRGAAAHIAWGGSPATFNAWLHGLMKNRLDRSYRGELFINAWNEWAEKAVMEPSQTFGTLYLDVLASHLVPADERA